MKTYRYTIIIETCEEGGYHGWCPALRGCHTQGETFEETKKNIIEAIECHLESLIKEKNPIPIERDEFVGTVEVPVSLAR